MTRFEKIKNWTNELGFTVHFSNQDYVLFDEKKIFLNPTQTSLNLIYAFLHECGHIILSKEKNYKRNFKILDEAFIDGRRMRGQLFKYKQLKEEMIAWERGFELAKELGIKLNKVNYDKYAARCFMTYVKFAAL